MMNFLALISAFGIIAIAHLLHHGFIEATTTVINLSKPKGTVKTIKSDYGDIIDCISIYKQISFDNPLIKSSQLNLNLEKQEGEYLGASAKFSVPNPRTQQDDFSLAQIWLITEMDTQRLNAIEAGWTSDRYNRTGCYNLLCEGFVQTSRTFAVGSPLSISSEIKVSVFKDSETGNWWLQVDDEFIGYWPRIIFNALNSTVDKILWGGEVYYKDHSGEHTTTEMGNGQFPVNGTRASHVRNLQVMKRLHKWSSPDWSLTQTVTKPKCYDLRIPSFLKRKSDWGVYFYYGGPGRSRECP
ncbi:uncharacterized protein LOC124928196 [Impatiens glandulifera]|uniref:uncharacterized protein LOC124928196 n=1 Tax=Impatiens glandulifera TaxID=253017 RepID=UPI001FB06F67|nr:uncharacterized protein LOC124928196 [Impatiens glandulifera]